MDKLGRALGPGMNQFKEFGLTAPQLAIMGLLDLHGPSKITSLAEWLDVKPSAVTVMIDRMESAELIARRDDESDRRVVLVSMTDLGKEMMEKARGKYLQMLASYFNRLTLDELRTYTEITEKLTGIVQKESAKIPSCQHQASTEAP